MVDVGAVALEFSVRAVYVWRADVAFRNVRICRGNGVEYGLIDAIILGKDRFGRMSDPVIDVERSPMMY